jgi:hypothetical protein
MSKRSEMLHNHAPNPSRCSTENEHCITCSDQALPARVLSVDHARGLALVEIEQTTTEIDVTLIEDVQPGDTLLVHGGVALSLWL